MIELALIGLCAVILFFLLHLRPLSDDEVDALAAKRKNSEIHCFFSWSSYEIIANSQFKSAMNKNGATHQISEPLPTFPALAAGLLKSKKHEWIIFGFARNRTVELLYFNKGPDRGSVAPFVSMNQLLLLAGNEQANTVLCIHNHPNGVLQSSSQDIASANNLASVLNPAGVSLLEFVCGRGRFVEYYRSVSHHLFPLLGFKTVILRVNGQSRMGNISLHLERIF